jgi:hypothetical protein
LILVYVGGGKNILDKMRLTSCILGQPTVFYDFLLDNNQILWYYSCVNQAEAAASHLRAPAARVNTRLPRRGNLCLRLLGPHFCLSGAFMIRGEKY